MNPKAFIWMPIALGVGIELLQLLISLILRYPYRVIDINDSILNAVGVLIGYGFFRLFSWGFISMTNRFKLEHRGLIAYIQEMVK
jgi:glycopeptide antibiotics resistance protein